MASTTAAPVIQPATKPLSSAPSSAFDAAGNERFTGTTALITSIQFPFGLLVAVVLDFVG